MRTHFIPLSGKSSFPHTYVLTTDTSAPLETVAPSTRSLTPIQRGRLATKDAAEPYFKGEKTLIGSTVRELKGEKITPRREMINAKLLLVSNKAIHLALQRILRQRRWEELSDYLQDYRKKLKENFHQFYLRIREQQEELKRSRLNKERHSQ